MPDAGDGDATSPSGRRRESQHASLSSRRGGQRTPAALRIETAILRDSNAQRRGEALRALVARQNRANISIGSTHAENTVGQVVLEQLPGAFFELFANITTLRISCGLERLPSHVGNFRHLRHLDLRRNNLLALPYRIQELNLQTLFVDNVLSPDMTELMLTDFVYRPAEELLGEESLYVPDRRGSATPSVAWLGGPHTLKDFAMRMLLRTVSLSELDIASAESHDEKGRSQSVLRLVPTHLLPRVVPPEECAQCGQAVLRFSATSENQRQQLRRFRPRVVCLQSVVVEHVFCSRRCVVAMERVWRDADVAEQLRRISRGVRFVRVSRSAARGADEP
ncbi:uncharacterized protein V1518DRAFT_375415 [Limtongia smithiae]|uniref:uncharacterized protein n=1 Tax=Limtongia smithiae TaxID=1125753 RepID=UPI0034CE6CF1